MEVSLNIGNISWIHLTSPGDKEIQKLIDKYDVHEIIEEDLFDETTQDKIDIYDDYIFLVLHFQKYDKKTQRYRANEFKIILGKKFIVSITTYQTNSIEKIKNEYEQEMKENPEEAFKYSSYYILYRILDTMYDKSLLALAKFAKDLTIIEESVFFHKKLPKLLLESLLIKKRNSVFLRHIMKPQKDIMKELNDATRSFFKGDLDVYFEDLEYKIDKINSSVDSVSENIEYLANIYNSLANVQTNSIMSVLTIFTALVGMMTMITGLYGMNVTLPFQNHNLTFFLIIGGMVMASSIMLFIFKKKGRL